MTENNVEQKNLFKRLEEAIKLVRKIHDDCADDTVAIENLEFEFDAFKKQLQELADLVNDHPTKFVTLNDGYLTLQVDAYFKKIKKFVELFGVHFPKEK